MVEESKQMKGSSCFLSFFKIPFHGCLHECMFCAWCLQSKTRMWSSNALSVETHLQVETYQNKPHILPSSVTPLTPSVSNAFRKKSLHEGHHFLHIQMSVKLLNWIDRKVMNFILISCQRKC